MEARRQGDRDLPRQLQGRAAALRQGATTAAAAPPPEPKEERRRLPLDRTEIGRKFQVGEYEGYIHVGLYDDGTPGDIFVDIAKEGTTLAGLMNSFMISVSLGLQYGVPLEVYVSKFAHMRFEPSGMTNDPDIRVAKSIVDYIFRWMGKKFLDADKQQELGIMSPEVKARLAQAHAILEGEPAGDAESGRAAAPPGQAALFNAYEDAVECAKCGGRMVRNGHAATRAGTAARTPGVARARAVSSTACACSIRPGASREMSGAAAWSRSASTKDWILCVGPRRRRREPRSTYMGHASIQSTYELYGKLMQGSESEAVALVHAHCLPKRPARPLHRLTACVEHDPASRDLSGSQLGARSSVSKSRMLERRVELHDLRLYS